MTPSKEKAEEVARVQLLRLKLALRQDELDELHEILTEAQEVICGAQCKSYFPNGHVKSEADHSAFCRRVASILKEA